MKRCPSDTLRVTSSVLLAKQVTQGSPEHPSTEDAVTSSVPMGAMEKRPSPDQYGAPHLCPKQDK